MDSEIARLATPGCESNDSQNDGAVARRAAEPIDPSQELTRLYTPQEGGSARAPHKPGFSNNTMDSVFGDMGPLGGASSINDKYGRESIAIEQVMPYTDEVDDQIYALHEKIRRMRQARTDLEAAEEYIRADNIRLKLIDVFAEDKKIRLGRLKRKQELEVSIIEDQFGEEKIELEEAYKMRRINFEKEAKRMREALAAKQKVELDEYTASLEKKHAEVHPKYSSKLLEMRYTQAQLLRAGRYKEATKKRGEADAQQQIEDEKRAMEAHQNIVRLRKKMQARQVVETEILENKIKFSRKALNESYQLDRDKLINRQTNVMHEITLRHKHETVKLKKAPNDSPFALDETGQDIMATDKSGEALYAAQMANKTILTLDGESILRKYIADEYTVAAGTRAFVPTDTYRQTTLVYDDTINEKVQDGNAERETHVDDTAVADRTHDAELELSGREAQSMNNTSDNDDQFDLATMNGQGNTSKQNASGSGGPAGADSDYFEISHSGMQQQPVNMEMEMERLVTPQNKAPRDQGGEDAYDLDAWED